MLNFEIFIFCWDFVQMKWFEFKFNFFSIKYIIKFNCFQKCKIIWTKKKLNIIIHYSWKKIRLFMRQNLCSTLALIHIKMFNEPKKLQRMVFWFQLLRCFFLYYCRHFVVLRQCLSFGDSQVVLTFCSLNLVAPRFTYFELHRVIYWVS